MKGIILAGGSGTRLYPVTKAITKALLPVYDKPMLYYPLSTLMLAKIFEVLIIGNKDDLPKFKEFFGNGESLGMNIQYAVQEKPNGIAEAFIIAEEFLAGKSCCLILGDNLFYGNDFSRDLKSAAILTEGARIFAYQVKDPERYGVVNLDDAGFPIALEEKPKNPVSNYAITGLYFYDNKVCSYAKTLKPSARGELEITDINKIYLDQGQLTVSIMKRGYAWLDTGTHQSMLEASQFIYTIESRQGLKISCPEEIAWRNGWITTASLKEHANKNIKSPYGEYLMGLTKEFGM